MSYKYLLFGISSIFLFSIVGCKSKPLPDKMPADFKIEFNYDDKESDKHQSITLQLGQCIDEGRYKGEDFNYNFTISDAKDLEELYSNLKKINAFTIKIIDEGKIDSEPSISVHYVINGKDYNVDRKSTRLNSSHIQKSRMPSSA